MSSVFHLLSSSFSIFRGPEKRVPEHLGFALHSIFRIHSESRIQVATFQPCVLLCRVVRYAYSVAAPQVGIRYGHFYAWTLIDSLQPKIDPADAVVRISLVHYNTVQEVERIIELLDKALA